MYIYLRSLLIGLCCCGMVMGVVYYFFRRKLVSKLFAIMIPPIFIIIFLPFSLGREGISWQLLAWMVPLAVTALTLAFFFLKKLIVQPLGPLAENMSLIASEHDLSKTVEEEKRSDELAVIQASFNAMVVQLRTVIGHLNEGSNELQQNIEQIAAPANRAASAAAQQASAIAEVSTTLEQLNQTSRIAAGNAQNVVNAAEDASMTGAQGIESVSAAIDMVVNILDHVEAVADNIMQLNEQSKQIDEIVGSISELAEQSNLLAVNASIKASRAGEQGRGFAVVADEVRTLAKQSQTATDEIKSSLNEIRLAGTDAVQEVNAAKDYMRNERDKIDRVQSLIAEFAMALEQNSDKARQISAAANQQAAGIRQISEVMGAFAISGQDTAAGTKQLEQAVENLFTLNEEIQRMVSMYSV